MAVGEASPAVGYAAEGDGGGDGVRVEATPEVAGKEVPPPAEGMPGIGVVVKGAAAPSEVVPVKIGVEGDVEEELAEAVVVEEEEEKWLKLYSSTQSILTVGDGDFSFSLSLASRFGSGALIVATSLDASGVLLRKYSDAESNIMELKRLETTILHGVDVKTMKFHTDLKNRRFDRIVFNFPHAGFQGPEDQVRMINLHKELLKDFFCNARYLLMPYGEIHIRHKTGGPYDRWDLEQLASDSCLIMFEKETFQIADYPGYNQKRGNGARCDQPFNLGPSCTFKFVMGDLKKRKKLSLQRDCEAMMPGAAGLSYSSAFLEQCYRESVQRQEGLRAMMPGAAGLSYSSAFLEQCYRESVQRQERLNRMITYGCQ